MEISESSSTSRKRRRGHEEGMPESKDSDQSISLHVLAKLSFLVTSSADTNDSIKEEIRLRYRCLDLHRPQMSSKIMLRHQVVKLIRRYLEDVHGFVEIETPILSRSTPEGARDYLVPVRVQGFTIILEIIKSRTFKVDGPLGLCFGPFCLCT